MIYGGSNIPLIINVTNLNSGGFMIYGAPRYSASGWAVSSAGDINADGYDDLIIGAPNANFYSGIIYVIFGTDYKYENIDVSSPKFIEYSGFKIYGTINTDAGASVSYCGDINKDGYDDIIIGAPFSNSNAGAVYVIYGSLIPSSITLVTLTEDQGFYISGNVPGCYAGAPVSYAGDFNYDGYPDLIIGAPNTNNMAGESYIIYGAESGFVTYSPTESPSANDFFDFLNQNKDFISGGFSVLTFLLGWVFRSKIAYYVIDNWGFEYILMKSANTVSLGKGKIGICIIDEGSDELFFQINDCYIKAEINLGNNNGLSEGLYKEILKSLKDQSSSNDFELLKSEKNQIRDFLLSNDYLHFDDLGFCRGTIYKFCLSRFRNLDSDKHKLLIRKSSNSPLHLKEIIKELKIDKKEIEMFQNEDHHQTSKVFMSIDAMMDPEYVRLQNEEFIRFANNLKYFTKSIYKDIVCLLTSTKAKIGNLLLEDNIEESQKISVYQDLSPSGDTMFMASDNFMISLLSAKQLLHNLPIIHYLAQSSINYLGYNGTLPNPLDHKAILISIDLVLGNIAAQYLPDDSIMNGMLISTASTASYAVSLTTADYLRNQESTDDPVEFAGQCAATITAYILPQLFNYGVTKAILPDSAVSLSALDMLRSASLGVVQCYSYKAIYSVEGEGSISDTLVPYIADGIALWSLRGYLGFDSDNIISSVKNAINIASITYATHCLGNMVMDFVPQERYVDQIFDYSHEAVVYSIDSINQVIGTIHGYFESIDPELI